ncbi:hypothetical protein [Algoriphagus litoralis]|nr:hypothetical protein [Algoriphagus litoralis]
MIQRNKKNEIEHDENDTHWHDYQRPVYQQAGTRFSRGKIGTGYVAI